METLLNASEFLLRYVDAFVAGHREGWQLTGNLLALAAMALLACLAVMAMCKAVAMAYRLIAPG